MGTTVENLTDEELENIFSFCWVDDFLNILNVCSRWRRVAQAPHLWRHIVYLPSSNTSETEVVKTFEISPKLQIVDLTAVQRKKIFHALTVNCPDLRKLHVRKVNNIHIEWLKILQETCVKVEHLTIAGSVLTDFQKCDIVGMFNNLKTLQIEVDKCSHGDISLKHIADGCPKLECLDLDTSLVKMDELQYFIRKKKHCMRKLGVSCVLEDGKCILPLLVECIALKALDLNYYDYCHYAMKASILGRLKTLKALRLLDMDMVGVQTSISLFDNGNLGQLIELTISDYIDYNDDVTNTIVKHCPLLQALDIDYCRNFTDDSLKMLHLLKDLKSLSLSGNRSITDYGVGHLKEIKQLRILHLKDCGFITEKGLELITNCSKVQALTFLYQYLKGLPVELIASRMKCLTRLDICDCYNVDILGLEWLKKQMPQLKVSVDHHLWPGGWNLMIQCCCLMHRREVLVYLSDSGYSVATKFLLKSFTLPVPTS